MKRIGSRSDSRHEMTFDEDDTSAKSKEHAISQPVNGDALDALPTIDPARADDLVGGGRSDL